MFTIGDRHSFPEVSPAIEVTPIQGTAFEVDCKELRWWFTVPEIGDHTWWATYDQPDGRLTSVTEMKALRSADIHGFKGVEIAVSDWDLPAQTPEEYTVYGSLTDNSVRWLGIARTRKGEFKLRTFLDEDFDSDWGSSKRIVRDKGRFVQDPNGGLRQLSSNPDESGAGLFRVTIGDRDFTCLRSLDIEENPNESSIMLEVFITQAGRTVLARRYNGPLWQHQDDDKPWDERLPGTKRLTVDGITFIHWYDCLTNNSF